MFVRKVLAEYSLRVCLRSGVARGGSVLTGRVKVGQGVRGRSFLYQRFGRCRGLFEVLLWGTAYASGDEWIQNRTPHPFIKNPSPDKNNKNVNGSFEDAWGMRDRFVGRAGRAG